jgi:hypothetical protein
MTLPSNQVFQNGVGQVNDVNLNSMVQWCDTAANLRNFIGTGTMSVYLEGINTPDDGGQGTFIWSATGTNPDDNGVTTIIPYGSSVGNGEWIRQTTSNDPLIPTTASGANAITLTPLADTAPITAYANYQQFGFVAAANSTGPVTANVAPPFVSAPLPFLNVYQPSGSQAGSGTFTAGSFYVLAYVGSLNSNAGGFIIVNAQTNAASTAIEGIVKQTFTTGTGTYTPTTGMLYCIIECWGPGGGGGGTATAGSSLFSGGAGGGSGGYSKTLCTAAQIGASKAVTVSAFGAGAAAGNNAGINAAGSTSVGSLCVANGGAGGGGNAGTSGSSCSGGAGGVPGTGDVTLAGFPGGYGTASTQPTFSGAGGGPGGGSGAITGSGDEVTGSAATGIGGGGGGGMSQNAGGAAAGGAGGAGLVVIYEYLNV